MPTFTDPTLAAIHCDMLQRYHAHLTAYTGEPETFHDLLIFGLECCSIKAADISAAADANGSTVSKWVHKKHLPGKLERLGICKFMAEEIAQRLKQD